jgi:hypothetical protein
MVDMVIVPIYAKHFTRPHIEALTRFYEATDMKLFQEMSSLLSGLQSVSKDYTQKVVVPEITNEITTEYTPSGLPATPTKPAGPPGPAN